MTMEERVTSLEHRMEKTELADVKRGEQNDRILTLLDGPLMEPLDIDAIPERDHREGMNFIQKVQGKDISMIKEQLANGLEVKTKIRLSPTVTAAIISACGGILVAIIYLVVNLPKG